MDKLATELENLNSIIENDESNESSLYLDEGALKANTQEILNKALDIARQDNDFNILNNVLKALIEVKKAYYPATQKSVQANTSLFDKELAKWFKAQKELRRNEKGESDLITVQHSVKDADGI